MVKATPHEGYPPEEGRYIRGNDSSPVAVATILNAPAYKIPPELQQLVEAGIRGGAALSGMVQTENIGIEKMVCNIVSNPNIRYLVIAGPESEGHLTGEALKALLQNGIDEKRRIIGTKAPVPLLANLPMEFIERFRSQLSLVDLQFQGDPQVIERAVWSCCQMQPVEYRGYTLYDTGAYPGAPLSGRLTWRVLQPWNQPEDDQEAEAKKRVEELTERLKARGRKGEVP